MRGGALIGLRGGSAPLSAAQAAIAAARDEWLPGSGMAELSPELARYGDGAPLADCPALAGMLENVAEAAGPVDGLLGRMLPALAAHPLAQVPLRAGRHAQVRTLLLAREGRAYLSLVSREPGQSTHRAVSFCDGQRHEVVLAGRGRARLIARDNRMTSKARALVRGSVLTLDLGREALLVDEVEQRLVTLRLVRVAARPAPTCEYMLETCELLHQSAGDPGDSRRELQLALLGRMRRSDAAPVIAEMTQEGSDHLRWQALRECLALDTAVGFAALCDIAGNPADSLSNPAIALRNRLRATHPVLEAA